MREVSIRLDTIDLALKNLLGKIQLRTELTLGLPEGGESNDTSEAISSQVAAGNLWVEKASPCRLDIHVRVKGDPGALSEESLDSSHYVDAIRACPAWKLLGLQLSRTPREVPGAGHHRLPTARFYVSHMTAASCHLSSQHAPRAEFRNLSLFLDFDFSSPPKPRKPTEQSHTSRRSSDARTTRSMTRQQARPIETDRDKPPYQLSVDAVDRSARLLVRGSLFTLLGIKKRTHSIRRLRPFESPSLVELAPGVWNLWYLQEIIQRAPFLHTISSVLSRLANDAQSPVLKVHLALLGAAATGQDYMEPDYGYPLEQYEEQPDSVDHIGQKIWPILQTGPSYTRLARGNTAAVQEPEDLAQDDAIAIMDAPKAVHDPYTDLYADPYVDQNTDLLPSIEVDDEEMYSEVDEELMQSEVEDCGDAAALKYRDYEAGTEEFWDDADDDQLQDFEEPDAQFSQYEHYKQFFEEWYEDDADDDQLQDVEEPRWSHYQYYAQFSDDRYEDDSGPDVEDAPEGYDPYTSREQDTYSHNAYGFEENTENLRDDVEIQYELEDWEGDWDEEQQGHHEECCEDLDGYNEPWDEAAQDSEDGVYEIPFDEDVDADEDESMIKPEFDEEADTNVNACDPLNSTSLFNADIQTSAQDGWT